MKTYKNLYPRTHHFENLYTAYRLVRKGKRGRVAVGSLEFELEGNLLALESELREQSCQPGAYTNFCVHEPKRRLVSAALFRDRVVHHALCRVIEPMLLQAQVSLAQGELETGLILTETADHLLHSSSVVSSTANDYYPC